jgi:murein DD-endopeptidase MepM/ murein hydrolase activator NlpD
VLGLLLTPRISAADDKGLRIVEQRQGETIVLLAKLINALDVTMTLTTDMENLSPSIPLPATFDSDGKSEVQLVTLHVIDRTKPYKYGYRFEWKPGGRQKGLPKEFFYTLPYKDGPHRVRQGFLGRFSHYTGSQDEYAIDWSMPIGTKVYAARAGTVVALRSDVEDGGPDVKYKIDYNYIVVRHDDCTYAEYLHLDKDGVKTGLGDKVSQGQFIGISGNTGFTSEPHLHFAVFNTVSGHVRKTIPIEFLLPSGRRVTPVEGRSY